MPEKKTLERARRDKREGKAPTTQAGEFVREEMEHIREGKHGARSTQQAIAIGLSKARRSGVNLKPPLSGSSRTRRKAEHDYEVGHGRTKRRSHSKKRASSSLRALKREGHSAASRSALSRQAKSSAARRRRTRRTKSGGSSAKR